MTAIRTVTTLSGLDDVAPLALASGDVIVKNTTGYRKQALPTTVVSQPTFDAHAALTTTAHGGLVASSDARLTDSRTPTAHAASHLSGSDDILDSLTGYHVRQRFVSGRYYISPLFLPSVTGSSTNVLASNGQSCAMPWPLRAGVSFSAIGTTIQVLGSAGCVVRLVIYGPDNTLGLTAVPLRLDAGTIDGTSTGSKEIVINWTVPTSGIYYVMAINQGAPVTVASLLFAVPLAVMGTQDNLNLNDRCLFRDNNNLLTGAAPATWPPQGSTLTSDRRGPVVFLKVT